MSWEQDVGVSYAKIRPETRQLSSHEASEKSSKKSIMKSSTFHCCGTHTIPPPPPPPAKQCSQTPATCTLDTNTNSCGCGCSVGAHSTSAITCHSARPVHCRPKVTSYPPKVTVDWEKPTLEWECSSAPGPACCETQCDGYYSGHGKGQGTTNSNNLQNKGPHKSY
jgi:hypothetical protein